MNRDVQPFAREGLLRRGAPFGLTMALALAAIPLPPAQVHEGALIAAVAATVAIVAAVALLPWERMPRVAQAAPPLAYLVVVALLRHGEGGAASSYAPLVILPVLWIALYGTRAELVASIAGMTAVLLAPIALAGPPEYPDSEWRRAAVWILLTALVGFAVQRLVSDSRGDLAERRRAERYIRGEAAVTRVLGEAHDVDAGLEQVLDTAGRSFELPFAALWRRDRVTGRMKAEAVWQAEDFTGTAMERATRELALEPGAGFAGRAAASGEPVWSGDLSREPGYVRREAAAADGLHSAVAVPIMSERELFGVIEFHDSERAAPPPELIEALQSIGRQVGQFLERRRAERDLVAHAENIAAVLQATREMARNTTTDTARAAICEAALKVSGGVLAALFEPDPDGRELVATAVFGEMPEAVRDSHLPFVGGNSGEVRTFTSVEPLFVQDTAGDPAVSREMKATSVRSVLFQPVVRDGRSIGVLTIAWSRPMEKLPERAADVLTLLAAEAAVAIERADLLARLESVARTDELTGLANRRAWDEQLPLELARAHRSQEPMCMAMLDLDHFKLFNDELGHQAGDRLLKAAAAAWRAQLRSTDTLTRYGGEEFAAVLPSCTLEDAVHLIERVRAATPAGQTCSAGVAHWNGEETADQLVARADQALYEAKHSGRDRVVVAAQEPG